MKNKYVGRLAAAFLFLLAWKPMLANGESVVSFGVESRSFYSRWFEYGGYYYYDIYYEEDFSLTGLRAEIAFPIRKDPKMAFWYGFTGSLYPAGSYVNSYGDSYGA